MNKRYCFVALFLLSVKIPFAIATPNDNQSTGKSDTVPIALASHPIDTPIFTFGGFGSLGVSHSSQDLGDYVLDGTLPQGAGRSSYLSASNNSRVAAHVNANFTPTVSAILQVITEYHSDGTFTPEIEWANVKYAFNPKAYVRVGRIALPTFLDSDSRDVGYTYTWVHPPVDLYRQLAIAGSDGIDGMYRFEIGDVGNSVKALFGRNTLDAPTSTTTSRNVWGIFDNLEYGQTTFHAGYQKRESSTQDLITNHTGPWISNSDLSLGVMYDPGDWFAMSEWIQSRSTTKIDAMYISAGYRINKFTPYATYSQNSPGSFLPGFPAPTASDIQSANRSQSTVSLGVRWDFRRDTAFKLQFDQVTLSDNSNGYLANVPDNVFLYGSSFHVISAVVDFVF